MGIKTFEVKLTGTVRIAVDEAVIAQVDDEWKTEFYPLNDDGAIAKHLAYNMVVNGARLTQLDGWADLSDDMARVEDMEWEASVLSNKPVESEPGADRQGEDGG